MVAKVPGSVHTDLLTNGIIANPYEGCTNMQLAWIDSVDWEYAKTFEFNQKICKCEAYELVFEGLDTHVEVYLNSKHLLSTDNMFRRWAADCTNWLVRGKNEIIVIFRSSVKKNDPLVNLLPYRLPRGDWAYSRKAAYHFGWDWGPRFVTCGIWKPLSLRCKSDAEVVNLSIGTLSLDSTRAVMALNFDLLGKAMSPIRVRVYNDESGWVYINTVLQVVGPEIDAKFSVVNPKLWWPNGMDAQNLYPFRVYVQYGKRVLYDLVHQVGIRTLKLVAEPDSIGMSFYFKINGTPVFVKEANVIPSDFFVHSINDSAWVKLVRVAAESNFNMLRVWGGGVYAPDAFMQECTKRGIMVWHDFMFACSMYPWNNNFLANVIEEAIQQVKRLRAHTSLALWCGNNEIDEGWHNWGWMAQVDSITGAGDSIWNGYRKLFHELPPSVVKRYDSGRDYWPSSPLYGWGKTQSMTHGDSHYWGVWWGREPFERYAQKVPRFMSECGFQGAPSEQVLNMFSLRGGLPDSAQLRCHQKHPVGYEIIDEYMMREGFKPRNLSEWVEFSQRTQAQGYAHAIESHRLASPYCMGTLYWQLNDCWPVVSWSGIDYAGNWKMMQHYVKNLYKPVIAGAFLTDSTAIVVKAVSDKIIATKAYVSVQIIDINGNVLYGFEKDVLLQPKLACDVDSFKLPIDWLARNDIYLKLMCKVNNELHFESVYYFTKHPHPAILNYPMVQRIRIKLNNK